MPLRPHTPAPLLPCLVAALLLSATSLLPAQNGAHRTRLYLKDGSYQVVLGYTVGKDRVRYESAERSGAREEIPLALVDLARTEQWQRDHAPGAEDQPNAAPGAPSVLSPELAREEAERAALMPEVAPDLRLASADTVLALDTFRGTPELVPLAQSDGDLNRQTGHSILKAMINPASSTHQLVVLKGEVAQVQLHVAQPELYIRLDDAQPGGGSGLTVDTHGASSGGKTRAAQPADYVITRLELRQDARVVASFNTSVLGPTKRQQEVVATTATELPGGHWLKLVPTQPLLFGEYAVVEVLGDNQLNLGVWDFGIHPTAPENRDVLKPEKRRPSTLERRRPGNP